MKQSIFMTVVIVVALIVSALIFYGVFGNINNFKTPEKNTPANIMGAIYLGGPIVVLLMALSIMVITFTIERQLSLSKAKGRGPIEPFLKKVQSSLLEGNIDDAIAECDKQRGSIANILRQGLDKYQSLAGNNKIEAEQKLQEVQSAIEEAMMLEVPLLEKKPRSTFYNCICFSSYRTFRNSSRNDKIISGACNSRNAKCCGIIIRYF